MYTEITAEDTSRRGEHLSRQLPAHLTAIIRTVRQPLLVLDANLQVLFSNRFYAEAFPTPRACKNCPWDFPALRKLLETALPADGNVEDFEATLPFPILGDRLLRISASRLSGEAATDDLILVSLEDVTGQQGQHQAVTSAADGNALFESSPLPSWVVDRETFQFLAVNQAALDHYGYTRQEFLNLTVRDIRLDNDVPPLAMRYGQLTAPLPRVEIDQHRRKDGTIIDVEIRRHSLVYTGRNARLVVATEISRRGHAEKELEQKTREILTVWESMTDAFYAIDSDWRFTYINAEGEKLLRQSRHNLVGQIIWDVFPDAIPLAFYTQYRKAMREQVPVTFDEYFPPLDLWSEVHAYPSPVGLSVYFRDITERRRSDAVLQKSMDMLQAITEGTTDAVFVKDRDGRYLMINSAGARIMGAAPGEIIGRDDSLFFDEDMAGTIRSNDLRTMKNDVAITCEEVGTSGGVRRTFMATKAPYRDSDGNVIGVIGISRDISEQKRLQGQLAQSERLAAMGELVAGVAHELNNPLAAISGNAQLLLQHPDAQVRGDAETIKAMTDRAARIVRSLVTFSRHVDNAERRPLSLHHLIDGTLEMIRYKLRKSNVDVVRDLAPSDLFPPIVAGRIEQVLLNLFVNAEYALRDRQENREIRIRTRTVPSGDLEWATIAVSDNGAGIPSSDLPRIFNPFFTTKPHGEGTGLGLSICHGIMEEHEGKLTVESDGETGTTFTLWLPMVVPSPADT